jgi:hypothetical protein
MIANRRSTLFYIAMSCVALGNSYCHADYIGRFPTASTQSLPFQVSRIHDDGTPTNIDYASSIPTSVKMNIETYGEATAVTSDLKKVYQFVNTLGYSNYIIASDANTGQYLPNDTIALGNQFPSNAPQIINQARQPLVAGNNELFVLSQIPPQQAAQNSWQIKHFDLTTKNFIESIDPPTPQKIDDVAFRGFGAPLGFGDQLYFSTPSGIYVETRSNLSGTFGSLSSFIPPLVAGVDGNIAIGPDNRLYVRNFANGDVQRYSLTGQFIDTFISHTSFPDLGTIQFGVDGNLHVYQGVIGGSLNVTSHILKFSPLSGSLLASTPNTRIYPGRVTFVPVPEPTTAVLLSAFVCCGTLRGRAKR